MGEVNNMDILKEELFKLAARNDHIKPILEGLQKEFEEEHQFMDDEETKMRYYNRMADLEIEYNDNLRNIQIIKDMAGPQILAAWRKEYKARNQKEKAV